MNAPLDRYARIDGQTHRIEEAPRVPALAPRIPIHTRRVLRIAATYATDANPLHIKEYENKHGETQRHTERVACMLYKLVTKHFPDSMSPVELTELVLAGVLHDIGKLQLDPETLYKPAKLIPDERKHIETHVEIGANLIREIPVSALNTIVGLMNYAYDWALVKLDPKNTLHAQNIAAIALQHHERLDGAGYPYGIKGNELSWRGRLISMVDQYDGMVDHRRDYRVDHYTPASAIDEMIADVGTKYDRRIFFALCGEVLNKEPGAKPAPVVFRFADMAHKLSGPLSFSWVIVEPKGVEPPAFMGASKLVSMPTRASKSGYDWANEAAPFRPAFVPLTPQMHQLYRRALRLHGPI